MVALSTNISLFGAFEVTREGDALQWSHVMDEGKPDRTRIKIVPAVADSATGQYVAMKYVVCETLRYAFLLTTRTAAAHRGTNVFDVFVADLTIESPNVPFGQTQSKTVDVRALLLGRSVVYYGAMLLLLLLTPFSHSVEHLGKVRLLCALVLRPAQVGTKCWGYFQKY